ESIPVSLSSTRAFQFAGRRRKEMQQMGIVNFQYQGRLLRARNGSSISSQKFSTQVEEPDGGLVKTEDNHQRFARLVLPYLNDAYALGRWITANRTDAEDVVQEASLRAFRAIANVADGNSRAWVLTIVRNTAYTWLRKNRPSAVLVVDDLEAVENAQGVAADL